MSRKICVVTGTRAEYGLLRWVMQGIKDDPELSCRSSRPACTCRRNSA